MLPTRVLKQSRKLSGKTGKGEVFSISLKRYMMQYFKNADPDDMSQGDLSSRVNFLKREKGGYEIMCEAAEKIYHHGIEQGVEEGREEGRRSHLVALVLHMHDKNYSEEQIVDVTDESLETIKEIIRENR